MCIRDRHVETTKNTTAKLGFFFDIWGKEFNSGKILDYSADDSHMLEMTVNGQNVDTFEETALEPLLDIEIMYRETD